MQKLVEAETARGFIAEGGEANLVPRRGRESQPEILVGGGAGQGR